MNPPTEPDPHETAGGSPDDSPAGSLDGNAAAGLLREIFAVDLTSAVGRCAGCRRAAVLAQARLYGPEPGVVLRCRGCDGVLLRVVTAGDRAWLDLRGLAVVEVALAD